MATPTDIFIRLIDPECAPTQGTASSAGWDVRARINEPVTLNPGERRLIPLGLSTELPDGWEAQVRPRSGLALKHGITVLNSPGTIDADYRGEVGAVLINHGDTPYTITPHERVAQLVFAPVPAVTLVAVGNLSTTDRGEGGFASTGTH